jgi:hypothetical protein
MASGGRAAPGETLRRNDVALQGRFEADNWVSFQPEITDAIQRNNLPTSIRVMDDNAVLINMNTRVFGNLST